jgi:hypothetical protein
MLAMDLGQAKRHVLLSRGFPLTGRWGLQKDQQVHAARGTLQYEKVPAKQQRGDTRVLRWSYSTAGFRHEAEPSLALGRERFPDPKTHAA